MAALLDNIEEPIASLYTGRVTARAISEGDLSLSLLLPPVVVTFGTIKETESVVTTVFPAPENRLDKPAAGKLRVVDEDEELGRMAVKPVGGEMVEVASVALPRRVAASVAGTGFEDLPESSISSSDERVNKQKIL